MAANDKDFWAGLDISKLPSSGVAARDIGCVFFYTGIECLHGHVAPRYAKGGRCVACAHASAERDRLANWTGKKGAARAHLIRSLASIDGHRVYVPEKPCVNGHYLRWTGSNNCVECDKENRVKYAESRREARLKKKYGITNSEYSELAKEQGGKCKICTQYPVNDQPLHVDHCHKSGAVRGLLCSRCNQAIGLLCEDVSLFMAAAEYIKQARQTKVVAG
ncbi:hypothetical protein E2A64_10165 [Pseudohoeflea suaedae]|uniref:Recombination endonuclease VII n=1 Tax=Pseudohoeflea suaedae TaxID=877384 RepID=A0A4R5PKQ7_9HYPH|nr:hypothetical protein E2A64_10165 [Pseudohoeflea suaedae]